MHIPQAGVLQKLLLRLFHYQVIEIKRQPMLGRARSLKAHITGKLIKHLQWEILHHLDMNGRQHAPLKIHQQLQRLRRV